MIYGVDVSSYQGAYPWNSGEAFGFAKATEGTFYRDARFAGDWDTMYQKKILRGAYHFGHPGTSAKAQADYFVAYVKSHGLLPNDVLALDLEVSDGLSPSQVAAWAVQFVAEVEKQTGKNVWVYTMHSYISGGYCAGLYKHPLWIADPNGAAGSPSSVAPWPIWTVHQYSSSPLDKDVLNGNSAVWDALANLVKPVTYKTVTAAWTCGGVDSLTELCKTGFAGTMEPGTLPAAIIMLTLANTHGAFAGNLAQYINGGDLAHTPVPKGVVLYYPKRVKA